MHYLCFMSNLSSEQWAAWVQAIGSILAIIAAFLIASLQLWFSLAKERREQRERAQRIARLSTAFGTQLIESITNMTEACTKGNRLLMEQALSHLNEVVEFSRSVDVAGLPANAIRPFMTLRILAGKVNKYFELVAMNPSTAFGKVEQDLDRMHTNASNASLMLAAALGDKVASVALKEEGEQARV